MREYYSIIAAFKGGNGGGGGGGGGGGLSKIFLGVVFYRRVESH